MKRVLTSYMFLQSSVKVTSFQVNAINSPNLMPVFNRK